MECGVVGQHYEDQIVDHVVLHYPHHRLTQGLHGLSFTRCSKPGSERNRKKFLCDCSCVTGCDMFVELAFRMVLAEKNPQGSSN